MRIFVTGASGFIGSAVVPELLAHGHRVIGLARSDTAAERLRGLGAEPLVGSLDDTTRLAAAAADSDGVVHLAYRHGASEQDAMDADRRAVAGVGEALAGSNRPLVVTSGTLVLPAGGRTGTEDDAGDPDAAGAPRIVGETAAAELAARGVRSSVVRLAPCVHDTVRRGFVGALIDAAERHGVAAYVDDGAQRWPAVHRLDAAALFRAAVEEAPAGAVLHGVGEPGVRQRDLAELIGRRLGCPVRSIPAAQAAEHFGWVGPFVATDAPASSDVTQRLLGWRPVHPGLLDDLDTGEFFAPSAPEH